MNYEKLIQTITEVINNEMIYKKGLTLVYELPEKLHRQMNEDLFYRVNKGGDLKPADVYEVEIEGIIIKFIKKDEELV